MSDLDAMKSITVGPRLGYCRVSTEEQSLENQRAALKANGCIRIFEEKVSGAKRERIELDALLSHLRHGDTVVVTRLIDWRATPATYWI